MLIAARPATETRWPSSSFVICTVIFVALGLTGCSQETRSTTGSGKGVLQALDKHSAPIGGGPRSVDPTESAREGTSDGETTAAGDLAKPPMKLASPPADAQKTASGIACKVLRASDDSRSPTGNDTAQVHYNAWKTTGELIYSTRRASAPQPMPMFQAPPGWREIVLDMQVGERRLCWMPGHLASAVQAKATAMTLVFDVELVDTHNPPPSPDALDGPPENASRTASGLAYEILTPGANDLAPHPDKWDEVAVHYTIWKPNGTLQKDTTFQDKPHVLRPVDDTQGFAEAVSLMTSGQRNRVWIPEALRTPLRAGDPGGLQIMEIELVGWEERAGPPPVPRDITGPPATAQKTARGVYYESLKKGAGDQHPQPSSTVRVHYTGWTTDGKMFDSSLLRGEPAEFGLTDVIAGWTDVVQVMVVGDAIRTWIPEKLAYQGKPNLPAGMLVFEIELLAILD